MRLHRIRRDLYGAFKDWTGMTAIHSIYDYNLDSNSITGYFYFEQDRHGLLWMNSESHGIYSFNPVTGKLLTTDMICIT
jgi:hypothetical protein